MSTSDHIFPITVHLWHRMDLLLRCKMIKINLENPKYGLISQRIVKTVTYKRALTLYDESNGSLLTIKSLIPKQRRQLKFWRVIGCDQRMTLNILNVMYPELDILWNIPVDDKAILAQERLRKSFTLKQNSDTDEETYEVFEVPEELDDMKSEILELTTKCREYEDLLKQKDDIIATLRNMWLENNKSPPV